MMSGNHQLHNEHVWLYYRFKLWIADQAGKWMARDFYSSWAELERENQVKGSKQQEEK